MTSKIKNNLKIIEKLLIESGLNAKLKKYCEPEWDYILSRAEYVAVEYTSFQEIYQYEYFKGFSNSVINISLVLYHNEIASAIWPLMLDTTNLEPVKTKNNQYGGIVVPPLFINEFPKKSQRKIIKHCIKFLNSIIKTYSGNCWRSNELVINDKGLGQWYQLMMESNAELKRVNNEMFVDLSLSTESYRKFIRKSYRPLISLGYRSWETNIMDEFNCSKEIWKKFQNLHKYVSGKITRTNVTWDLQYDALKNKDAFLVYILGQNKEMIGGGFFDISTDECNYGVGAYDRNFIDQPLGHMIQYHAIKEMKKRKIKWYRLGYRFYKEEPEQIDNKRVNISNFTQGFLTHMFPRIELILKK